LAKPFLRRGDYIYRRADYDGKYFRNNGVVFWVYALLISKTGKNLPGIDAGFTKQVRSVPRDLSLTEEQKVQAKEAITKGILWYCKIEEKGWNWRKKNGAKKISAVHECVEFVSRFENSNKVGGAKCIQSQIINKVV
jgi:hypothetical protein